VQFVFDREPLAGSAALSLQADEIEVARWVDQVDAVACHRARGQARLRRRFSLMGEDRSSSSTQQRPCEAGRGTESSDGSAAGAVGGLPGQPVATPAGLAMRHARPVVGHDYSVSELGDAVAAVLAAASRNVAASQHEPVALSQETVTSLLRAGEEVVAYEVLCDNLSEDDIRVPADLLTELQRAVQTVGADRARVQALLE
jgi:hypothetical protein